ncbi:MAG: IS21 family transposase [Myxococcaceae bacterium]|nr:IS21 family transposase [Myxococcaceae bacterium]
MVEHEVVRRVRVLRESGWGAKRIARELGLARNTVRRYLRLGDAAEVQVRPAARRLDTKAVDRAVALWNGPAEGNAIVVQQMLATEGIEASARTVQRAVEARRREVIASVVATVRFDTAPGRQMQIDFGEKKVLIAGQLVRVYLLVAVLSHSRRLFVKAFLNQRGDDWREGIAEAFMHFGGVPLEVLGDNAKALVVENNRQAGTVRFHPAYVDFCRHWDVQPKACGPYRARTKGKTESGVKFVKRNALAGRSFEAFASLETHLSEWMRAADERVHGTTHERPRERFERDEKKALRAVPARPPPRRQQLLRRRVANDALVDVDTVRYSVPHALIREHVDVLLGDEQVSIFQGATLVATHRRSNEPYARVVDPAHWKGLWRPTPAAAPATSPLQALGRSLSEYADVVERGAA